MKRTSRIGLGLLFLVVSGLLAFSITAVVAGQTGDDESASRMDLIPLKASSLAEAEAEAGYSIATPSFMPAEFVRMSISVGAKVVESVPQEVVQVWQNSAGERIYLYQDPIAKGLIGGVAVEIGGTVGERVIYPGSGGQSGVAAYFWRDGQFGYSLVGPYTDSATDNTLIQIAESIKSR